MQRDCTKKIEDQGNIPVESAIKGERSAEIFTHNSAKDLHSPAVNQQLNFNHEECNLLSPTTPGPVNASRTPWTPPILMMALSFSQVSSIACFYANKFTIIIMEQNN